MRKEMSFMIQKELSATREKVVDISDISTAQAFIVHFLFEFPCPDSDPVSTKNLKMWDIIPHNKKPDLSNLIKFYEDCANGVIFHDDSMIIKGRIEKKYSQTNQPRVVMTVIPQKDITPAKTKEVLKLIEPTRVRELMKACHILTTLPLSDLETCSDEKKKGYLDYISLVIMGFANEFANDLTKIKKKCPIEGTTRVFNTNKN